MNRSNLVTLIIYLLVGSSLSWATDSRYALWRNVERPTMGAPQSIGNYTSGCLAGGLALPLEGAGFVTLRPQLRRNYGHPTMIRYLRNLGEDLSRSGSLSMLVEDIASPRGGPTSSWHLSHQTGLDVDISLYMADARYFTQRDRIMSLSFVDARDNTKLNTAWSDSAQTQLIVKAAAYPEVNRIFVAPAIKQYFCTNFPLTTWGYKLRAWDGHDDHIHVRLNCPQGDSACQPQSALSQIDSQCEGNALASFFADWQSGVIPFGQDDADDPSVRFPRLPEMCDTIINL